MKNQLFFILTFQICSEFFIHGAKNCNIFSLLYYFFRSGERLLSAERNAARRSGGPRSGRPLRSLAGGRRFHCSRGIVPLNSA